jgi:hypothetical protein
MTFRKYIENSVCTIPKELNMNSRRYNLRKYTTLRSNSEGVEYQLITWGLLCQFAHSTLSELGDVLCQLRRFHLRLFIFDSFGILGRLFFVQPLIVFSLCIALLWANSTTAQDITKARIETVTKNGLHKMIVPSEIRSRSKDDLSDFRIFDAKNNEVPYFLVADVPEKAVEQFEEFSILSKTVLTKKSTTIEIENPKAKINGLKLLIANSEVTKKYSISGSNDQKEWFGLVNNAELGDLKSELTTSVSKEISFPLCAYRFLKIVFDDSATLPINVLKIGKAQTRFLKGDLQNIKVKSIETTPVLKEKKTLIRIAFDYPQFINKVVFDIPKTNLFKRSVRIYTDKERTEKQKIVKYQDDIAHFSVISNQDNHFDITNTKQEFLIIEIENQDNPPLQISGIQFFQRPIFVVADLKANESYTVTTSRPNLMSPNYDLEYFKETISDALPETHINGIEYQKQENVVEAKASLWQQPWFMWLCIGIGGLAILFFSVRLIKDL